jgi:hypothetical protein
LTARARSLLLPLSGLLMSLATAAAPTAPWAAPSGPVQLLPLPNIQPSFAPAPLPPPTNPGYAAAPPNGLSPLLTRPGPVYQLPSPAGPAYPPPQLPGPVDQQKMQAYRNTLLGQQWQLQQQGVSPDSERSREIQQQLNAPDSQ